MKNVDVDIPLSVMNVVTGVSGSGKSSLVNEVLYKALAQAINNSKVKPGDYDKIIGMEQLDKIIDIDQSPIGRTPRSNPATYTGVFDDIRNVFAQTNEAKIRGYQKDALALTLKAVVAKHVKVTALSKLKCISYRMYTYLVKSVMDNATIEKRSK